MDMCFLYSLLLGAGKCCLKQLQSPRGTPSLQFPYFSGCAPAPACSQLRRWEKLHRAAAALSVSHLALQVQFTSVLQAFRWGDHQVTIPNDQGEPRPGQHDPKQETETTIMSQLSGHFLSQPPSLSVTERPIRLCFSKGPRKQTARLSVIGEW